MAATVGSVIINLKAQTAQFDAGMAKGTTSLKAFGTTASNVAKKLATFTLAAATAALAGTTLMVKSNLQTIDSTAKLARQLGIGTESLLKLRFAAELALGSSKGLNAGLITLVKRVGEAAQGLGAARVPLKQLGLDARELASVAPDEMFKRIADAMLQFSAPAERGQIAANLFSKANQDLVNILALGREGIDDLGRQLGKTGALYDTFSAQQVEDANDALSTMKTTIAGAVTQLTIKLSPAIKAAAEAVTGMVIAIKSMGTRTLRNVTILGKWAVGLSIGFFAVQKITSIIRLWSRATKGQATAQAILLSLTGPAGWAKLLVGAGVAAGAVLAVDAAFAKVVESGKEAIAVSSQLGAKQRQTTFALVSGASESEASKRLTTDAQRTFAIMREASDRILRFGMSADELAVAELRSLRGVGEADIAFLRRQQERFAALEATSKAREEAVKADERRQDAFASFFRSAAPAALERGTASAFSAANRIRLESGERNIPALVRKADEQLAVQKEMNRHLIEIAGQQFILEEAPF